MKYHLTMKYNELTALTAEKMIRYSDGNVSDINHFMKVWSYTRVISLGEKCDEHTLFLLGLTAIVHDIACPLCRVKYKNTDGRHQEEESPALVRNFFSGMDIEEKDVEEISFLVSHHHTYSGVNSLMWQILLEADYLVNADEHKDTKETILKMRENVFRTETGKRLLDSIYLQGVKEI